MRQINKFLTIFLLFFLSIFSVNAVLNDAVLYYSFDDGSSNYNVFGATGSSDGMQFTTSGSHLYTPNNADIQFTRNTPFSVSTWVYVTSNGNNRFIMSKVQRVRL